MKNSSRIARFHEWQDRFAKISSDVGNLLLGRHIFRESQAVIVNNPNLRGIFIKWMRINYANSTALGIRRAVDTDQRTISLANVLRSMIAHPDVVARRIVLSEIIYKPPRRFRKRYEPSGIRDTEAVFLNHRYDLLAGEGSEILDKRLIGRDLTHLQRKAANVERFATKRLAHYDEEPSLRTTYTEIDEALDVLDSLVEKYSALFGISWRSGTTFDALFPGWKEVFENPWMRRGTQGMSAAADARRIATNDPHLAKGRR
jgi:hypothetical protein